MPNGLDLDILTIHRRGGYAQSDLPGLHVAAPPRRLARRRADDVLVLFLQLKGNSPLTASQQNQVLEGVTKTYYEQRGSVTAAMHAAGSALNHYLLDRNRRSANSGLQSVGLLAMIVTREDQVFLAQSGPMHTFWVNEDDSQHLYDSNLAGRGLGTTQTTPIRFNHASMQQGGLIVLSPAPPPTWTAKALKDALHSRIEVLHRDLISQSGPDLAAVICKVQPGTGQVHLLRPVAQKPIHPPAAPARPGPAVSDAPQPETGTEQHPAVEDLPEWTPDSEAEAAFEAPRPLPPSLDLEQAPLRRRREPTTETSPRVSAPRAESVEAPPRESPTLAPPSQPKPTAETAAQTPSPRPATFAPGSRTAAPRPAKPARVRRPFFGPMFLSAGRALGGVISTTGQGFRALLSRMMPGEGLVSLPAPVMMTIAIAVPVIFVAIATVVYYDRGLAAQHQIYYNQASQVAAQTLGLTDPDDLRRAWGSVLGLLETAAAYGSSPEADALHNQAKTAWDQLEGVNRVAFQEALTTRLTDAVQIGRMAATNEDLYLLNTEDGTILRSWRTGRGYEFDPTFRCGPGAYGSLIVGRLIDLTALPKGNEFNATVLGMDVNGNLLYCIPGQSPIAAPLVPPDSNWGNPLAITFDSGNLYILDPQTNAVWMYVGTNGAFNDRPRLYFGDDIPPMKDVIDLAANRQDLYLLHEDGHLTTCTFSALTSSPTRCEDPAFFTDTRPGRGETPVIQNARFSQILFNPPPDPSLFLLDDGAEALYHFSVRLTFQRQIRTQEPLGDAEVTSFAVSPDRTVFFSAGNRIFFATIP